MCPHQGGRNTGGVGALQKEAWEKAAFRRTLYGDVVVNDGACNEAGPLQRRCVVGYTT